MKTKLSQKSKFIACVCALLALFLFAPAFLIGCNNSPSLSTDEKVKLIINETSTAITTVGDDIMEEYESSQLATKMSSVSKLSKENSYPSHTKIDRGATEQAYKPISQMTISFGYYALSEYYVEYIPNFINQTLFIEQTYYPNQKIWSKCELNDSTMDIHIWTEFENAFDEYINITIEYNNQHKPTKFTHRENRHWKDSRDHFGYIEVNFKNNKCIIETIKYKTNNEIDYNQANSETITANMDRYIREEFGLNNYKKRTTSVYEPSYSSNISEEQMIKYAKEFDYAYTRHGKPVFDFENETHFADGDEAMDYAFDKYLIIEDRQTGKLERVRPKNPNSK